MGWKQGVAKRTMGGLNGYSGGKESDSLYVRLWYT